MSIVIPADWFMGDENPMAKIAWFLYDNADKIDDGFMSELIEHLHEFDAEKTFTLKDHKPRVAAPTVEEEELGRLRSIAEPRVILKLQEKELARRKKAKKEIPPLLALADGLDINEDVPLPTTLYDFDADHVEITHLLNVEVKLIQAEERREAEAKRTVANAKKKVKKKPAKKKVSVDEMKKKKAIS